MIHEIIPVILSAKSRIVWCGSALKKKKKKGKRSIKNGLRLQGCSFSIKSERNCATKLFHSLMTMLLLPTHPAMLVEYQFRKKKNHAAHSFLGVN